MNGSIPFADLFLEHAAASLDKQLYLGDAIGDSYWHFNKDTGIITFGEKLIFHTQILGTESLLTNTWLWGWANEASEIPLHFLLASLELKAFGMREDIKELTEPNFPLSKELAGHHLAMLASGVCQANCYYRCPYEDGALFVLIKDPNFIQKDADNLMARIVFIFTQLLSDFSIRDHRKAFISYLKFYNLEVLVDGRIVEGRFLNGEAIVAEFDGGKRLEQLALKVQ